MQSGRFGMRTVVLGAAIGAALLWFSTVPAEAVPVCSLSGQASPPLELLPQGCEFTLANGPVVFSGMAGTGGGNTHTVMITEFDITPGPSNTLVVFIAGTDQKNSMVPTIAGFGGFPTVSETDTTQSTTPIADNATTSFNITTLLLTVPSSTSEIRLDPADLSSDNGSTTVTDLGGGNFKVSSFFDVFVDLTLDGTFGGLNGNGLPNSSGPQEIELVLSNVPEPASLVLLVSGLIGFVFVRRRRGKTI